MAAVRNHKLVRICENLETPAGNRIVESQASGIPAADEACRHRQTAPPLFVDHPARLEVLLFCGRIPVEKATRVCARHDIDVDSDDIRLVAWAIRYDELQHELDPRQRRAAELDLYLAARLCAQRRTTQVAKRLTDLESAGVLRQAGGLDRSRWVFRPDDSETAEPEEDAGDRMPDLLSAIAAEGGEASRKQIGERMGFKSNKSASHWINRAMDKDLVEPTTESRFHPGRAYTLTRTGEAVLARST